MNQLWNKKIFYISPLQSSQRVVLWEKVSQQPWAVISTQEDVLVTLYFLGELAVEWLPDVPAIKDVLALTAASQLISGPHWPSTACPGLTPSTWRSSGHVRYVLAAQRLSVTSWKSMVISHIAHIFCTFNHCLFNIFFHITYGLKVLLLKSSETNQCFLRMPYRFCDLNNYYLRIIRFFKFYSLVSCRAAFKQLSYLCKYRAFCSCINIDFFYNTLLCFESQKSFFVLIRKKSFCRGNFRNLEQA